MNWSVAGVLFIGAVTLLYVASLYIRPAINRRRSSTKGG